jgi:hypothetical protein
MILLGVGHDLSISFRTFMVIMSHISYIPDYAVQIDIYQNKMKWCWLLHRYIPGLDLNYFLARCIKVSQTDKDMEIQFENISHTIILVSNLIM